MSVTFIDHWSTRPKPKFIQMEVDNRNVNLTNVEMSYHNIIVEETEETFIVDLWTNGRLDPHLNLYFQKKVDVRNVNLTNVEMSYHSTIMRGLKTTFGDDLWTNGQLDPDLSFNSESW